MDLIDRLNDPEIYTDAVDEAVDEIKRLRAELTVMRESEDVLDLQKEVVRLRAERDEHADWRRLCEASINGLGILHGNRDDAVKANERAEKYKGLSKEGARHAERNDAFFRRLLQERNEARQQLAEEQEATAFLRKHDGDADTQLVLRDIFAELGVEYGDDAAAAIKAMTEERDRYKGHCDEFIFVEGEEGHGVIARLEQQLANERARAVRAEAEVRRAKGYDETEKRREQHVERQVRFVDELERGKAFDPRWDDE